MNVGLRDFVRMAESLAAQMNGKKYTLPSPGPEPQEESESSAPLTIRILSALAESNGTSTEIAAVLAGKEKSVSGTLSNLTKSNFVKVVSVVYGRTAPAFMWAITQAGLRRLDQWRGDHETDA